MPTTEYLLGHSEKEIQRLINQAAILRPITERLLRQIELRPGMRVLDLGCGAGDVSMLAAELVGPSGMVLGIDRNPEVLDVARERSRQARLSQIEFRATPAESLLDLAPFDAVIGRYVLLHQADPVAFLQAGAAHVRAGGILALHEIGYFEESVQSLCETPLLKQVAKWILQSFQAGIPHYDVGRRILEQFSMAQLPQPGMFCEVIMGGGSDSTISNWLVDMFESVLPQLIKTNMITDEIASLEAMKAQIAADMQKYHIQIKGPAQICVWARL